MEASKQYCSGEETFSYRWLVTLDSYSLAVADGDDDDDDDDDDTAACSFIEMDPAAAASTRWTIDVNGFHFATAAGMEPPSFPYPSLPPPPPPPPPLNSKPTSLERSGTNSKPKSTVLIHGAASLKRILWTYYLCLLVPLRNKVKGLSSVIPKKAAARNKRCGRSASSGGSRTGGIEWCRSNADVSVYDAILHCKKSYGSL